MANKVEFVRDNDGCSELLMAAARGPCYDVAKRIAQECTSSSSGTFEATLQTDGKHRPWSIRNPVYATVQTADWQSARSNAANNTLLKHLR